MRTMMLTMYSTMSGIFGQMDESNQDTANLGQAFDAAKNDDSFYLPPEVFQNPDFQRAMNSFLSPDGKAARFIISHKGDPATPEGIARIDQIRTAAEEALKTTPLQDAKIYMAGTASTLQRFPGRLAIRSVDRRNWFALSYLYHHGYPHAKFCGRTGYRRYGSAFIGRIVRPVGAGLAISSGL